MIKSRHRWISQRPSSSQSLSIQGWVQTRPHPEASTVQKAVLSWVTSLTQPLGMGRVACKGVTRKQSILALITDVWRERPSSPFKFGNLEF